jgi:hypothetical protein
MLVAVFSAYFAQFSIENLILGQTLSTACVWFFPQIVDEPQGFLNSSRETATSDF